jgi:hypothetical protein
MGIGYQLQDRNVFDYNLWVLPDVVEPLRGPRRWSGRETFLTFLGAAQTFGRFVGRPFPEAISQTLGIEHINFGSAGVGPEFYLTKENILKYVNRSAICIVQVMSGRSVSTSLMEAINGGGMLRFREGARAGENEMAADAYRILAREYGSEAVERQVSEARERWVACYRSLFDMIEVPIILVWMSTRPITSTGDMGPNGNLGEFPQLIGANELAALQRDNLTVVDALLTKPTYVRLINHNNNNPEFGFSKEAFPGHPAWARDINTYYYVQRQHDETTSALMRAFMTPEYGALRARLLSPVVAAA